MSDVGISNVLLINLFEQELGNYEVTVVPNSSHFQDYRLASQMMKSALLRLVRSNEADTYSMMRILVAHVAGQIDDAYSDLSVTMLAQASHDEQAQQLIMGVLYITRELVGGEFNTDDLGDSWFDSVERNNTILTFFQNYKSSNETIVEETYSGNPISSVKEVKRISTVEEEYALLVDRYRYDLMLEHSERQKVTFAASSEVQPYQNSTNNNKITINTEVILTPNIGYLMLDASIGFFDDALAQMNALQCCPNGYIEGVDTLFVLPGLFYSLALNIATSDSGNTWRVTEVNILPPSVTRQLGYQ